jgi:hypothetical protein
LALLGCASTALLALAFAQTDIEAAQRVAKSADGRLLFAGCGMMTVGLVFLAARWRALMPTRTKVQLMPLTAILVTGTLLNYALPGPVGEFVAAGMAARRWKLPPEQTFAAGVHARFVGLALAGLVALALFLLADMPVPDGYQTAVGSATALVASGGVALFILSSRPALLRGVGRGILSLPIWPVRMVSTLQPRCDQLAALATVGNLGFRSYVVATAWALGGHACVVGGIGVVAIGLGATPNLAGLLFTYAMTTAGAVVLFAFPGSQVGWDALLSGLLAFSAGVPLTTAVGVAVIARVQQLFVVVLGAVAMVFYPDNPE